MRTVEILVPRVGSIGVGNPVIETTTNDESGQKTVRELWPTVHTFSQEKGEIIEMSEKDAEDAVTAKHARYVKNRPAAVEPA